MYKVYFRIFRNENVYLIKFDIQEYAHVIMNVYIYMSEIMFPLMKKTKYINM